ncbi:DNA-binding response regulator [Kocuria dechangensis]|uniref:Sensory transduction protein RegX3 n=1 Tax=Kocuria dechangensis TaxID=1176249 RepID=A0A917H732_9MICC|nr:response regulator transcription factor [Kocuria dechangensis]GGG69924.1 DNA-binding response regulator [Kocuria dechangensis]
MERILLVEDEASISDPLAFLLGREGFEVQVAGTGGEALDAFEQAGADLVLLDWQLPGMSGIQLCARLRARSEVAIIMVTARDTETDVVGGLAARADDYVTKPFSSGELIARIRAVLRRHPPIAQEAVTVVGAGRVRMDLQQHRVTVAGAPVALSGKGFELLEVFLTYPGQVLTRGRLIDEVWGADSAVADRALGAQIIRVRRLIEPDPGSPRHLMTVRGLGYRYDP